MSEKSPSKPLSGWLILHKDVGLSSAQAVGRVRRIFGGVKTGHAGTLDPLASGILPIALGEATKTINYVMTAEKTYRFSLKWGAETQTDDVEGEITRTSAHIPSKAEIEQNLDAFRGEILQIPPDYSAVKIGGKRAYALARKRDKKARTPGCQRIKPQTSRYSLPRGKSLFMRLSCYPVMIRELRFMFIAAKALIFVRWHVIWDANAGVLRMLQSWRGCLLVAFHRKMRFRWTFCSN